MRLSIYDPRVLALDLRHRRFGFAVFEGHRRLLDWGVRVYPATGEQEASILRRKLAILIRLSGAEFLVIKRERWNQAGASIHMSLLVRTVWEVAVAHGIPVMLLEESQLRASSVFVDCETRDDIAATLARIYPELLMDLPPKRKKWQSEHPRMTVFDAVALGLSYWLHEKTEAMPPMFDNM